MGIYATTDGNWWAKLELTWTAATELDLSHYVVAISRDNSIWQEQRVDRAETSCVILGLALGDSVYARMKAVDKAGNESSWSLFNAGAIIALPSDAVAPDNPTDLTTYSRFKSVHLTWTNPAQKDLALIDIYRYNAEAGFWASATKIAEVTGTSYTDEIGIWDSTWWYGLKAIDKVGNASTGTAAVEGNTDITAPAAPTNLSTSTGIVADADGHIIPYIDCSWTDSVTEDVQAHEVEVQYYISAAWQDPTTWRPLGTPFHISPAVGNVNYRVRVRALDDASLPSVWTAYDIGTVAKDNVAPNTPTGLAVASGINLLEISVDRPDEHDWTLTEFHVSTNSGFTPSAGTLMQSAKATRYTHQSTNYVTHYVKVRHGDTSENWSSYCAQGSGTPEREWYYDLVGCDIGTDRIYIYYGISGTAKNYFSTPGSSPYGLTYASPNLISCNRDASNRIYKHSGLTSTVLTSFASPSAYCTGLAFDGANLISCDGQNNKIYRHAGITSSVSTSFTAPGTDCSGLTYSGAELISCDANANKIYKHVGVTSTISTSFASPSSGPIGLAFAANTSEMISCDDIADRIYRHAGISSTVSESYGATSSMKGLTWAMH